MESNEPTGRFTTVYNFSVADWHTYFVASDDLDVAIWAHNSYSGAASSGRLVYDPVSQSWTSPGGLVYGQGSVHGNRVKHVLDHVVDNPMKPTHSILYVDRTQLIGLLDQVWAKKGAPLPNDTGAYVVEMGRVIGTAGQTKIKLVVRPNTNQIITAYPVL